jgi:5'-3' exonuclease
MFIYLLIMGVPHFFKTLCDNYPNIIFDSNEMKDEINHLCFDTNGLIHPCASKITKQNINISKSILEDKIIKEVVKYMDFIINLAKPTKSVYVAIDGSPPHAKIFTQRSRRFKSAYANDLTAKTRSELGMEQLTTWDTNAITPGTEFMEKLSVTLKQELKKYTVDFDVILSDSNVPMEGEHKILNYIKTSKFDEKDSIAIFGLDADLIFLSMVLNRPKMFLLREHMLMKNKGSNTIVDKEYYEVEYDYLSIDILKTYFHQEVNSMTNTNYNMDNLINDFIFLCFLIGNDFLPNMNCIEIGLDGLDKLLKIYYGLLMTESKHLIVNNSINVSFLKNLFKSLSMKEDSLFKANFEIRKRKHHRYAYRYDDTLTTKENKLKEVLHEHDCVTRKQKDIIKFNENGYRTRFYEHYFNIDTNNDGEFKFHLNEICDDYLKSLFWNFEYYFVGIKDYQHFYPHPKTPLASDIYQYMSRTKDLGYTFKKTPPPKPFVQLLMVLPQQSSHLLPKKYQHLMKSDIMQYYPVEYRYDMINKRFLHECYAYLPIIDYERILEVTKKIKLPKNESSRNTFGKDIKITTH